MTDGPRAARSGWGEAVFCRRRFLADSLRGATIVSFAVSVAGRVQAFAPPDGAGGVRIDVGDRVFNGQDLHLSGYLDRVAATGDPDSAALIRSGAGLAEALAWALAPSGAAETWRLDELARRGRFDVGRRDEPAVHRDRKEADRSFREALEVVLPGTDFLRLYVDRLLGGARDVLGGSAAARLARVADTGVLEPGDAEFLLRPDGPERALLRTCPLETFRRFTYYRYLIVHDLLRPDAGGDGPDLIVPAMAPDVVRRGWTTPPTSLADQVTALARIVLLSSGRVHPLVPFHASSEAEARDALALVQEAVDSRGFIGVSLTRDERAARESPVHRELLAWCERYDVPILAPSSDGDDAGARGDRELLSVLGLGRGRRSRARLERFYDRHAMAAPRWLRAVDEAAVSDHSPA